MTEKIVIKSETELKLREFEKSREKKKARETYGFLEQEKKEELFVKYLERYSFLEADYVFQKTKAITKNDYEHLKSVYIQQYIQKNLDIKIDKEKALALSKMDRHLLVRARAGSGKTRLIACKTALLIETEKVDADHVMILAFNKKAANEIRNRIRKQFGLVQFSNARTFHSLAYQLTTPSETILYDEKDDPSTHHLTQFVKKCILDDWNPAFQEEMYEAFRTELREMENAGDLLNPNEYYHYRRERLPQITLRGERVKSLGEKFIADFLCEHDIRYTYEKPMYWDKRIYRPDFCLFYQEKNYVIEHWGIDENDPRKTVPYDWNKSWDDYHKEIGKKRNFADSKDFILIETSISDLRKGRKQFEILFKEKLEKSGISCNPLPREEVMRRIKDFHISRMSELFTQFIQKAQKAEMTANDVQKKRQELDIQDTRTLIFLKLAQRVYARYEKKLTEGSYTDFDRLLTDAINLIESTKGECSIKVNERRVKIKDLKWVLIDEYQDFSHLFYRLISTIMKHNKDVRLLCVGDDWQAINGFAGSDLKYFTNFTFFPETLDKSGEANLLYNYRSTEEIVKYSNRVMSNRGKSAFHIRKNQGGIPVRIFNIDDIFVDNKKFNFYSKLDPQKQDDPGFIKARHLKKCYEILSDNPDKTCAILYRKWKIHGSNLDEFRRKLRRILIRDKIWDFEAFEKKVKVSSVHGYKGLEEDIVIILDACNGRFPLLHPDHQLFSIFGQTENDLLEEERRLFYVALTRAKEKLYILTEKENRSPFLPS